MPCGHFQCGPVQWAGGGHERGELTDGENRHGKRPTTCFVKKLRAWSLSPCDGSPPVMLSRWLSPRDGFKVARSQGFMVAWSNGPRSQSTTHKHGAQTRQVQFFLNPPRRVRGERHSLSLQPVEQPRNPEQPHGETLPSLSGLYLLITAS